MLEDYDKQKKKEVSLMRRILDYGGGTIILLLGIFFLFRSKINIALNQLYKPDWLDIALGVLFVLYGSWRIYRGYKKNYFR